MESWPLIFDTWADIMLLTDCRVIIAGTRWGVAIKRLLEGVTNRRSRLQRAPVVPVVIWRKATGINEMAMCLNVNTGHWRYMHLSQVLTYESTGTEDCHVVWMEVEEHCNSLGMTSPILVGLDRRVTMIA